MDTEQKVEEEQVVEEEIQAGVDAEKETEESVDEESTETTDNVEAQLEEMQERLVRQIAETENLRRRYEKQLEDARAYSVVSFAKDLLNVLDNLQRVQEHQIEGSSAEVKALTEGVRMTSDELLKTFDKNGISEISPSTGDEFDYNEHYAISYEETNSFAPNQIAGIMQKGYRIKDRLLRPAIVTVAKELQDKKDG